MKKTFHIESEVAEDYRNGYGLEYICKKHHIGKLRAKEIIKQYGIELRKPSSYTKKRNFVVSDWRIEKYPKHEGCHYIAKSKDYDYTTNDYMNGGGFLTTFIKEKYGIETPTLYDRRIYYQETGNYWWEQWFDIIEVKDVETKKCPYCDWETKDIENKSGAFEVHLRDAHNKTKQEYLVEFPNEKDYFQCKNKTKNLQIETNPQKYVECAICGKKLRRIDWRHLSLHGILPLDYIEKYGDNIVSEELHEKLSENIREINKKTTFKKESQAEKDIKTYLIENGVIVKKNRSILEGKEIDIYLPEKQIGIEFNGNFYHTEFRYGKGKYYHINKTKMCEQKGVALIQIFEDEWELSKEIVLSKIKHIVGLDDINCRIFARNCRIEKISHKIAETFLNENHIQGSVRATVHYGAIHEEHLIAVMSFTKRNVDEWELVRFASLNGYICVGVGGKLFKHFIKTHKPKTVKSFADRRWTTNPRENFYTKIGFSFCGYTAPDYKYFNQKIDRLKRFHKFGFRKKEMLKKYKDKYNLNESMTELQMAIAIGCDRIWDCGLIRYMWTAEDNETKAK